MSNILQNSIIKLKKKKKKTLYLLDGNVMQYVIKVQTHVFILLFKGLPLFGPYFKKKKKKKSKIPLQPMFK